MAQYDVTIIGSGPGGYVAAIRCAQLGMNTALIEKYNSLGGTCLNVGCIPSKALLDSTHHYQELNEKFKEHGINVKEAEVDMEQMIKRKDKVVKKTCKGVEHLMKKNKVDTYQGIGEFQDKNTITVHKEKEDNLTISTKNTIIATGSKPASLPGVDTEKKRIITSTEALDLTSPPKEMVIIGAGYIGLEMGSVFARVGTKVKVIEYMDRILPHMDKDLGRSLKKALDGLDIEFYLSHEVQEAVAKGPKVTVKAKNDSGKEQSFKGDYCLVAVGRQPYTQGLGLENIGLSTDKNGKIPVDENLATDVEGVYAIGDVIDGPMLAHKAEEDGIFVAERLDGQLPHLDYNLIPGVVYTWPEVASVGQNEEQLKDAGQEYKVGQFPFQASGRARASMDTEGFIKVLADKKTDEILGVQMIGPRIADLIIEGVVAMEYRASAEDIARMSHPHPTYTESFREACLAATSNRALHL